MLIAALSFGIMVTFVKYSSKTFSSFEIVFFRSILGSLAIAYLIWKTKASFVGVNPKILVWRGVSGFIALSMHFYAIKYLNLGTAVMLNYTAPIFVAILAQIILKEKISRVVQIAIVTSFLGLYLLTAPQFQAKPFPLIIGILSGLFAAISYVLIRYNDEGESPYTTVFYFMTISTIGSLPVLNFGFSWPNWAGWLGIFGVTFGAFFGQIYITKAIQNSPVSTVMPFSYITPVIASISGFLFWKESLSFQSILGGIIIIASGIIIYLFRQKTLFVPLEE